MPLAAQHQSLYVQFHVEIDITTFHQLASCAIIRSSMKLVVASAFAAALAAAQILIVIPIAFAQESLEILMVEQSEPGVTGRATITPVGSGQTEITVRLTGLVPGSSHIGHLQEGTGCGLAESAGIVETLTNIVANDSGAGTSTTTVNIDFDTVTDGSHLLIVRGGPTLEEGSFAIACGHISLAGEVTPEPDMRVPTAAATDVGPPAAGGGYIERGDSMKWGAMVGATAAVGGALLCVSLLLRRRSLAA